MQVWFTEGGDLEFLVNYFAKRPLQQQFKVLNLQANTKTRVEEEYEEEKRRDLDFDWVANVSLA